MGYIVAVVILILVSVAILFIKRRVPNENNLYQHIASGAVVGIIAAVIIVTLINSVYQVPAGRVGVVYEFGSITGQIPEGLQFITPWKKALIANTQVQSFHFPKLESFSEETQDVFVAATLNLSVAPGAIQKLYRTVGPNWFKVLVEPRVAQNFKDETVKYKSISIAPNREKIRRTVRQRLEAELSPYSIEISDLLLENIDFKAEFKGAIEKKQIATQNALEEEQKVLVERHKAEQKIEQAKGTGQSTLIQAEKQAEANRKLDASLSQQLIQYTMVTKLSDKIEVMILPSGQNFILGQDMLGQRDKTESKK